MGSTHPEIAHEFLCKTWNFSVENLPLLFHRFHGICNSHEAAIPGCKEPRAAWAQAMLELGLTLWAAQTPGGKKKRNPPRGTNLSVRSHMVNIRSKWKLEVMMESAKLCYPKTSRNQAWKTHFPGRGNSAGWWPEGGEPGLRREGWWGGRTWMADAANWNQEAPFPEPRAREGFAAPSGLLAAGTRKERLQKRDCCSSYGAGGSFQVDVHSPSPTRLSLPGPWGWYARSQGMHAWDASSPELPREDWVAFVPSHMTQGASRQTPALKGWGTVFGAKVGWERAALLEPHLWLGASLPIFSALSPLCQQTPLPISSFLKHASSLVEGCF